MSSPINESTLVLVKPGAVSRGRGPEILDHFVKRGFQILALRVFTFDEKFSKEFYSAHVGKDFFHELVETMSQGPCYAAVIHGPNALHAVSEMVGDTDPLSARPGTLRSLYGLWLGDNAVHRSSSPAEAKREIALLFDPAEIERVRKAYNKPNGKNYAKRTQK